MNEETNETTDTPEATPDAPGPTGEGIRTTPPGNPEVDEEALEKGKEALGRVKPY